MRKCLFFGIVVLLLNFATYSQVSIVLKYEYARKLGDLDGRFNYFVAVTDTGSFYYAEISEKMQPNGALGVKPFVIKNYTKNRLSFSGGLEPKYKGTVYFSDSLPAMKWSLLGETAVIENRSCKKAYTQFRGRSYIAWYDPSLPLQEGPFKFHGLPGVIVKLIEMDGAFEFTLKDVIKIDKKIIFYNKINIVGDYAYYKAEKKKWLKSYYEREAAKRKIDANCLDCNSAKQTYFFIEKEIDIPHN